MSREKRSSPRVKPFVARCRLRFAGQTLPGYVTDLSVRGACVLIEDEPPAAGTRLEIEVRFRHAMRDYRLVGEVKWAHAAGTGRGKSVGVRFLEMGGEERVALDRIVEEFHAQAARIG